MMFVKTYVAASEIEGNGLFAAEKIVRGTPMQMDVPVFDIVLTPGQVKALIPIAQAHVQKYAWTDDRGLKHIGVDNDRFVNHSDDPNMGGIDDAKSFENPFDVMVAMRDIEAGEEITEIYRWPGNHYITVKPKS
jgi:SET domain-containing protein